MINAWDLYWTLKLDDIHTAANLFANIIGFLSLILFVLFLFGIVLTSDEKPSAFGQVMRRGFAASIVVFVAVVVPVFVAKALLPTTKQMAAILVLPKIATQENAETLIGEAKELYELAKEGLRNMVKEEGKQ